MGSGIIGIWAAWLQDDCVIPKEKVAKAAAEQITAFFGKMNELYWIKERRQNNTDLLKSNETALPCQMKGEPFIYFSSLSPASQSVSSPRVRASFSWAVFPWMAKPCRTAQSGRAFSITR